MLLIGVKDENAWLISRWNLTYSVGWESICKAVKSVYEYYQGIEILVDNKSVAVANKEGVLNLDEARTMTIRGMSTIIGIPIMITFYNQTNIVGFWILQFLTKPCHIKYSNHSSLDSVWIGCFKNK